MAWYAPTLATIGVWTRRAAISIDNTAAGGTQDVNVTIPPEWDDFWTQIDASGLELRVCGPDGVTLQAYSVDNGSGGAFDRANRLGRIRIDAFAPGAVPAMNICWLYYASSSAQGTAAVATVIAAPITGYIELGQPNLRQYPYAPPRPGYIRPVVIASKTSGDTMDVWIDMTSAIERHVGRANAGIYYEEIGLVLINVYDATPADQAGMYDKTFTRVVFNQRTGQHWVRVRIQAGTSGTNYTIVATVYTNVPGTAFNVLRQKLLATVALAVKDLVPP